MLKEAPANDPRTEAHPLQVVVRNRQCIGCGFCRLIEPAPEAVHAPSVSIEYDAAFDHHVPKLRDWQKGEAYGEFVCPGREMDMPALARLRHGREPADPILGEVYAIRAAYASDADQRNLSASGGVIPVLLRRLFREDRIDAAYVVMAESPPRETRGRLVSDPKDITATHGSVYHPVDFGFDLKKLADSNARFAFVGLPCQIAALEMLKRRRPDIAQRHVLSIGLFCGGINTFRGIDYYLRGHNLSLDEARCIDYRNGSWPGRIRLFLKSGAIRDVARIRGNSRLQILRYVIAFQGYWMLPRCRICPDQIADFADIAVGDPHLPRFRSRGGFGFSCVVSRTAAGEKLMQRAIAAGEIGEEALSRAELIESQGYTLDNRRHASVYASIWRKLRQTPPHIVTYPALASTVARRHRVYAWVDLTKLILPDTWVLRWLRLPWQVFEYAFITFAPAVILRRIGKIVRNKGE